MNDRESEGEIKNGQSGEIGNIGNKTNTGITTTPITLKMNKTHPTTKQGGPGWINDLVG